MTDFRTEVLQFDDLRVQVIRSPRRRTLSLEVDHNGLKARAPMGMREQTIRQFIRTKKNWIRRHMHNLRPRPEPLTLSSGATLPYLDTTRILQLELGKRGKVTLNESQITVPIIQSHLPLQRTISNKLRRWYQQQADILLAQKVTAHSSLMQIKPPAKIKVRDYKRRWGSCNHDGTLSFNWRIMMAPESVIDYVTVHELAHLIEFNHSPRFWRIVAQQLPDWRTQQKWLADHGPSLYVI